VPKRWRSIRRKLTLSRERVRSERSPRGGLESGSSAAGRAQGQSRRECQAVVVRDGIDGEVKALSLQHAKALNDGERSLGLSVAK